MTDYEIFICTPRGVKLAKIDTINAMTIVKAVNDTGWINLLLPKSFDRSLVRLDNIIHVNRRANGGIWELAFIGFLRVWRYGEFTTELGGPGINELLSRRVVAYNAGAAEAEQVDYADDMLKEIFDHNLGGDATDTDRQWDGIGLSSMTQSGAGPEINKAFSRRNVLEVMQEICETSRQQGTDLYFDIKPGWDNSGYLTGMFTTYTGQPGRDRSADSGYPVFFGTQYGNLEGGLLEYDYSTEITVAYSGGQGERENRTVEEREDTSRSGVSAWNRREGFKDARNQNTTAGVQDDGDAYLAENRPKIRFTGALIDTPQARYGVDWDFGDRVACEFAGKQFEAVIKAVTQTIDGTGKESIDARIEVEL